ncbi:glutamine amidotransferase [Paracoccus denitrificans]|jgi:GMP synthase (glutamine-hydrolysing)|uniref:Glutamine amidotransferase class-I n=1 Tax=Paracoccus denitrificans (strain Pd 1222) TaxID=318586 RepID=A1B1Z2_PARDP|nr:glutamine amidotransferase [Paracoccus denitrificans]ABL69536.1 glutamine amidotransferase class-I [Paracoccus denitrificans PD1222]MBB4626785.1 GMP synthase (glutamine-hydrolyzing) [Paracoccus denitrificans]MCU7427732.1 glutamine amidotransferase [Paracoccus denitrificans]QAR24990.1 glutamine amidotransferase [Paracoccus denitrificans]UPV93829.1 glutamine amidotransferase [Paracoccus denitrificans]
MKSALILRHMAFEDLGSFAPVLRDAGYQLQDIEAAVDPLPDPLEPDLVVVLGGPIGVNGGAAYPCMTEERNWLAMRLAADRPTLGLCLGAQLMAAALGARVAPIAEKEIGFAPLTLTATGRASPLVHLSDIPMLHWHGEGFELPAGAERLAATPACETQGFARGRNILGLQFHPEAGMLPDFERWLIGHSAELAQAGIAPEALRQDARAHGPALRTAGQAMLKQWLRGLDE